MIKAGLSHAASEPVVAPAPAERIKAAYIYKFTEFVSWPEWAFHRDNEFDICVLGKDPVIDELYPLDRRWKEAFLIRILDISVLSRSSDCHILYISSTQIHRFGEILDLLDRKPVLTIGELPDFARRGGMIGFVNIDNRIRLELNRSAARKAGISFNAKMLEVASRVFDAQPRETGK